MMKTKGDGNRFWLIAFSLLVFGSSDAERTAPPLANQWTHGGYQTLGFPQPPWKDSPIPSITTKMSAAYDWDKRALRETYTDMCVPIFRAGAMWSCDFLNVNGTAFLLQHADRPKNQPECCIFLQPWSPPRPDFASSLFFLKNTTESKVNGDTVMWFQSRGVTPEDGGPFGYGYHVHRGDESLVPFAFYFGAFWNHANGTFSQANTVQYLDNWSNTTPGKSTWDVPAACAGAQSCPNWP